MQASPLRRKMLFKGCCRDCPKVFFVYDDLSVSRVINRWHSIQTGRGINSKRKTLRDHRIGLPKNIDFAH